MADGSEEEEPDVLEVFWGLKRRMCEKMIWASLRASKGRRRMDLASSKRMSSWIMQ